MINSHKSYKFVHNPEGMSEVNVGESQQIGHGTCKQVG